MSVSVFIDGVFLKAFRGNDHIFEVRKHLTSYGARWTDFLTVAGLPVLSDHLTLFSLGQFFVGESSLYLLTTGFPDESTFYRKMHLEIPTIEDSVILCFANNVTLYRVNAILQKVFNPLDDMMRVPILIKVKVPKGATDDEIDYLRKNFAADTKKRIDCDCGCVQREVHWVDFDYAQA